MFACGMSTRVIETMFADEAGKSLPSASPVSALAEPWTGYARLPGKQRSK